MKKTLYIIFFTFFSSIFAQNTYNHFVYTIMSTVKDDDILNDRRVRDAVGKSSDEIQFELFYNDGKALLVPIERLNNSQTFMVDLNQVFIDSQGEYFYDNNSEILENQKRMNNKLYIVEQKYNELTWEISDTKDTINGCICRQAIYKKKDFNSKGEEKIYQITVWYDDLFESSITPFGLVGLKGLVYKIDFNGGYRGVLSDKSFKKKIRTIAPFEKGERISEASFAQKIMDSFKEMRERRKSMNSLD